MGDAGAFDQALGDRLGRGFGFEQNFVVNGKGEVLYASASGQRADGALFDLVRPAMERLLAQAEQADHDAGTGVVARGSLMGIAAVRPIPPAGAAAGEGDPLYAVTVDLLDRNLFGGIARSFRPDAFTVVAPGTEPPGYNAILVTNLADGTPLAVAWPVQHTGQGLLGRLSPAIAVMSSALLMVCLVLLLQTRRAATALAESEARATHLASQDHLTGLANRGHFIAALERAVTGLPTGGSLALLFIDLDSFKDINDTLGHGAGDDLLRAVADRLRGVAPRGLAARFGGDEFVVMAADTGEEQLPGLLAEILATLRAPVVIEGHELQVGASIGAALAPLDATDGRELMRRADIALYQAKADGRGGAIRFEPHLEREVRRRRSIELELAEAIDAGQLALVYQPQVDVESERVVGFEALVRWDHPRRGRLLPGEFLPIAEGTRLITRIDAWVLRNACLQAKAFGDVTLAVNMSPVNLRQPDLTERVMAVVEETGFDPRRLELEITESAILGTEPETHTALMRLRAFGVRLALDDFGTGHASLVHIRKFPISKIKIDRSFIANLGMERDAASIVEYVVRLGRSLGITLTAEGVETRDQLRFLRAFGAQQAQGFLFSPPLPLEAALAVLERQKQAAAADPRRPGMARRVPS